MFKQLFIAVGFIGLFGLVFFASAQNTDDRIAFVIGNAGYPKAAKLDNPINDANAISRALKSLGFETRLFQDLKVADVSDLRKQLELRIKKNSTVVFYYAGHGAQMDGRNYLLPVDANFRSGEAAANDALYLGDILHAIERAKPKLAVVILDACRDNPFKSEKSGLVSKQGLARVDPPTATVVFYATRPGGTASDGDDVNGLFTKSLLAELQKPDVPLEVILRRVSTAVYKTSKGDQEPWIEGVIREEFVIHQNYTVPVNQPALQAQPTEVSIAEAAVSVKPEIVAPVMVRSLKYADAIGEIHKKQNNSFEDFITSFACAKDTCTPYKDWVKSLKNEENVASLKKNLELITPGKIVKVCDFDLASNSCKANALPVTVFNMLMMFMPKAEFRGLEIIESKTSKSGGLSFVTKTIPFRGDRRIDCNPADGRIEFLNDKVDLDISRHGCFGILPSSVKVSTDVLLVDYEKNEYIVNWNFNMFTFMAVGTGGGVAKLSF